MGVQVTFNYQNWALLFPQFNTVPVPTFNTVVLPLVQSYCRNDGSGPVNDPALQLNLMNLMAAHITQLFFGANGAGASPLVGRIASAGEGSVNVSVDMPSTPANSWYMQTPYGAAYWQLMAPFRSFVYMPPRKRRW